MRRQHSFSTLSYFYRQGNNSTSVDLYDRSILEFARANGIVIDEKISTKGSMSYNDSRIIGKQFTYGVKVLKIKCSRKLHDVSDILSSDRCNGRSGEILIERSTISAPNRTRISFLATWLLKVEF